MASLEHFLVLEKNVIIAPNIHVLTFAARGVPKARPGQFFELKSPYFLRRPISVMQQTESSISFGIKAVGKGTEALCKLIPGKKSVLWDPWDVVSISDIFLRQAE